MAAKPKVLILTPDFPPDTGGIQLLIHRLAATLTRLEPLVLAPGDSGAREFDRSDAVPVRRVAHHEFAHAATILRLNAAAFPVARDFKPDVVLSAHIVVSPAASFIRRWLGIPVVQYLYANEVAARPKLTAFSLAYADATVAISRHTWALAQSVGGRGRTMHLIPPGVDLTPRHARERDHAPTIVTVARLEDRYKGHDTMIRALPFVRARIPDVRWVVIGTGPRRAQLEQLAQVYGLGPNVKFLGRVSDDERDGWLERAHVFAMPSRLPADGVGGEGFGIVYIEANWHELPVVAGNVGGALDAVVDGETGLLADPEDPVAVAEALIKLLADRELARTLGRQGAERAREFAWPIMTSRVEDVLVAACRGDGERHR